MSGEKGFPKVYDKGMIKGQPFIVQQKLGLTINDLLIRRNEHFSLKTVITLGISMLDRLQVLHDKGFLHCDIKPDNVMIGEFKNDVQQMNTIYLIDFGISSTYLDEHGNHRKMKVNVPFKGNVIFASKNSFHKITLSRRDDIISLTYFLNYLIDTNLKWFDHTRPIKAQIASISKFKRTKAPNNFLGKKTKVLLPFLTYAYNLEYDERPNY